MIFGETIRGRLISYLSFQAIRENSDSFTIPFNRQQLADYLSVDRSALVEDAARKRQVFLGADEQQVLNQLAVVPAAYGARGENLRGFQKQHGAVFCGGDTDEPRVYGLQHLRALAAVSGHPRRRFRRFARASKSGNAQL